MSDTSNESNQLTRSSVKFFVSEHMLMADFTPDSLAHSLDENTLLQLLESSGFGKHQLDEECLLNMVQLSENNYQGEISVEKHTDASFEVIIDKDLMTASLVIKMAHYGEELNYNEVLESIIEQSIHHDYLDTEILKLAVTSRSDQPVVIAKGIKAVNGEDSKFEVLFNTETKSKPKTDAEGNIDHYETHDYITVYENQAVMKRTPHTKGTPGFNVMGEKVSAENGSIIKFTKDETVKIDSADPNLLIAAKKGHPIALVDGVHIDDTLTVKNASLRSGNIHFDGSVEITGEVLPNVVIEATGDIFVHGMVENASLIAGNNITVGAGILSSMLFEQDNADEFQPECTLKAKGTITAKYCNSICATAKDGILIEDYSMHSWLYSDKHIIFGNNNGKGVIIGGTTYGRFGITANVIGSDAYVKTDVACGALTTIQKRYNTIFDDIKRSKGERALLVTMLNTIKTKGTPLTVGKVTLKKAKKLNDEIKTMKNYIKELKTKLISIKTELKLSNNAKINIQNKLYSNVQITINDIKTHNVRNRETSTIHCEDYELHFN